jgi:hypothetical protein
MGPQPFVRRIDRIDRITIGIDRFPRVLWPRSPCARHNGGLAATCAAHRLKVDRTIAS